MTAAQLVALGAPDPHQAGDRQRLCGALSDVVTGMDTPLACTRGSGHASRGVAEHASSGPYESRLPVVVGAWVPGGAPRILEANHTRSGGAA